VPDDRRPALEATLPASDAVSVPSNDATLPADARPAAADELREGAPVGEYKVVRLLGAGAFGTVYEGLQPLINKRVAIKVLRRRFSDDADIVDRFVAEARAVNTIGHPGIIDIFSFGELADGRRYFVMELLKGESLRTRLQAKGRLSVVDSLPILRQIATAVDAAHAANIVHRDLKPDNTFLCDGGTVKLLDFGVAKLLGDESSSTATGAPIGTPIYMAPEQVRNHEVGPPADIYALGAMTYELLTGEVPIRGADIMELALNLATVTPQPPSQRRTDLPESVDGPILAMLEKDPKKRPASATEAIRALEVAAPEQRPSPRSRTNRLRLVMVAAGILVIGTGAVVGWSMMKGESIDHTEPVPTTTRPAPRPASTSTGPQLLADAKTHSDRARALFADQRYQAAATEFELAYQSYVRLPDNKKQASAALSNKATSLSMANDPVQAIETFKQVLAELDPADREGVQAAIAKLSALVGTLELHEIVMGSTVRIDGRLVPNPYSPITLPVGGHELEVIAPGGTPRVTLITILGGQHQIVPVQNWK
jgi:serine/threonine protein kinase